MCTNGKKLDESGDDERKDIPETLEECFEILNALISEKEQNKFKEAPEDQLFLYHHTLGLWIRNSWIYPTKTRIAQLFLQDGCSFHPDDMSSIIIKSYHRYLNHKESLSRILCF
jgi:hypothetical protein